MSNVVKISDRAKKLDGFSDFLEFYMTKCAENLYDQKENPEGYLNLGTIVNRLTDKMIIDKVRHAAPPCGKVVHVERCPFHCEFCMILDRIEINENGEPRWSPGHFEYFSGLGDPRCRSAVAKYINKFFNVVDPITEDMIVITPGITGGFDVLSYIIGNPGDVLLLPTPFYPRIFTDSYVRSDLNVWPIDRKFQGCNGNPGDYELTVQMVESAFNAAINAGKNVCGIVIVNPDNPTGKIYSLELLEQILLFCKEHKIHALIDEVYAMSRIFGEQKFQSVLSLASIPDPQRTHVMYSTSKDFPLAGFRVGAIITRNKLILKCLSDICNLCCPSMAIQQTAACIFEDHDWLMKIYFPTFQAKLNKHYRIASEELQEIDVPFLPAAYGLTIWANFGKVIRLKTKEDEMKLMEKFMENKVYIIPGTAMHATECGWFRITVSTKEKSLITGMRRIKKTVMEYRH